MVGLGLLFAPRFPTIQHLLKSTEVGGGVFWGLHEVCYCQLQLTKTRCLADMIYITMRMSLLQWMATLAHRYAVDTTILEVFLSRRKVDLVYYITPLHDLTAKKDYNATKWVSGCLLPVDVGDRAINQHRRSDIHISWFSWIFGVMIGNACGEHVTGSAHQL